MFKHYALPTLLTIILVSLIFFQPRIVYGSSVEPTIQDGQFIVVFRFAKIINRNDFWISEFNGKNSVKRVVGLPGELIEVKDGGIFINGILEEPYFETPENWYEVSLAADEYFLAGDNRAHSSDSVLFGPVRSRDMNGKVIYF